MNKLFNKIGEARTSIMFNGEVVGIWRWDKRDKRVLWEIFEDVDDGLLRLLQEKIKKLESCLIVN